MLAAFIYPPETDAVRTYLLHMSSNEEGIGLKPPLGVLFVASYLKSVTGHEARVFDGRLGSPTYAELAERVAAINPDVVGVTAWTEFWYPASQTIKAIRARLPKAFIVVGGPHVMVYPEETLAFPGVDAVVAGEGERPMARLMECLDSGQLVDGIPGLHFKRFGVHEKLIHTEPELDHIPIPDRTLLPLDAYSSVLGKGRRVTTMITSRGCPNSCVFCKIHRQKPLKHSAGRVLAEFDEINRLGIGEVEVYDETFTWSHERVREICQGLIERGCKIKWAIRDRVSNVREDTLQWLRRAGCTRIHFGIESGSDEVLRRVKKHITIEQARRAVSLAHRHGFEVLTFFMVGLPGETMAEARQTLALSLDIPSDYSAFSITVPYPGTEMYREGLAQGVIDRDFWREFALDPTPGFQVPHHPLSRMSLEQLYQLRDEAHRRFYFRPRIVLRQLKMLKSGAELKRKCRMALSLARSLFIQKPADATRPPKG